MSPLSTISTLPRTVVKTYLSAARLPLVAVARINGEQDNEQWPPALAFESFEAGVESVLGSLLRDEQLAEAGQLRKAKVAQLRKAGELEVLAEQTREQADQELQETKQQAADKRKAAAARAEEQQRHAEQEEQQRKAAAAQKAVKKTVEAREAEAKQQEAIERREREHKAQALAKESQALAAQQEALSADATVSRLDDAIDASKEQRSRS